MDKCKKKKKKKASDSMTKFEPNLRISLTHPCVKLECVQLQPIIL
jgi:hypothetical protein